jgi:hypothetical protein
MAAAVPRLDRELLLHTLRNNDVEVADDSSTEELVKLAHDVLTQAPEDPAVVRGHAPDD